MSRDRLRPASSGSGDFPEFGLSKRRREIIRRLESAYAEDDPSLEDYEHRVHVAEQAMRIAELNALIATRKIWAPIAIGTALLMVVHWRRRA